MRTTKRMLLAVLSLGAMVVSLALASSPAGAHAWVTDLPSRQEYCSNGTLNDCGPIQYEPQSVEGPKGFPSAGAPDNQICSAGLAGFDQLNDPRGGNWPATNVSAGSHTFTWYHTARHSTTDYRYYITNGSYDPNTPLTRSELDLQPLYVEDYGGRQPNQIENHTFNLPDRTGRQMILAYWEIADTGNAFYACIDVDYSGNGNPDPDPPEGCDGIGAWGAGQVYQGGDEVTHSGEKYRAKWWTQGDEPGTTGQWGVWEHVGACSP
ncbi:lytic polysaccharide monooxygenase auxiliary activity family 9 protein [Salininema proteolyticum]|uniref:Lytic polysaccharide monooxygenase n=1 Tax=Salininema proteolyticum TaxID=1607685 RepID=A0ABV8U0Y1_9ACTN